MQVRRPVFLLALGSWLLCLAVSHPAGGITLPLFCILLVLFPMRWWVILLCFVPLLLPVSSVTGEIDTDFSIVDQGIIKPNKIIQSEEGSWQYFGTLREGEYSGIISVEPFSQKNSRWFFNQAAASRGLQGEAKVRGERFHKEISPTLRQRLLRVFYDRMEGMGEQQGMAFSLLFGLREGLERELEKGIKELGMLHLFVLSGLHLGIYYRSILSGGKALLFPRALTELIAFCVLIFFCYLTNWHVSALRTLFLAFVRSAGFYFKRKPDKTESLSVVCLLLLWINPAWAGSLSFILGTLAYGALRLSKKRKFFWMMLALLPLQWLLIGKFSVLYLFANLLLSALSAPILGLLFVAFVFPPFQSLLRYLLAGLTRGLHVIRDISWLRLEVPTPVPLTLICIYLLWFVWLLLREKKGWWERWRTRGIWLLVCGVIISSMTLAMDRRLKRGVTFFDVGQGDASLIMTPNGRSVLIDTGRDESLLRELKTMGIQKVDMLILSHLDDDHSALAQVVPARDVYVPMGVSMGHPLKRGDRLQLDGVEILVLHPSRITNNSNEDSLVLLVSCYGRQVLYTGDIGAATFGTLDVGWIDVLKFPHHGAAGSLHAGALERMQPYVTILSVGRNHYGHPSPAVLEALESRGLRYHNTWESGHFFFNETGFRSY
ncbi:MAG TPA: MBL fold metallo-hydrolase [Tissierellia bacterium]|nr:MBL fold metallo-hydrolase [Tissierellia bacterium]